MATSSWSSCRPPATRFTINAAGNTIFDLCIEVVNRCAAQGKFQLVVMPAAGHAIHEDEAGRTADQLLQFLKRFRVGEPPLTFPPRAAPGVRPVLPIPAGPLHEPARPPAQ